MAAKVRIRAGDFVFRDFNKFFKNINKQFGKNIKSDFMPFLIKEIKAGRSPVKKFKKFVKYSKSYRDQIKGKVSFRTINGRVVPIRPQLEEDKGQFKKYGKRTTPVNLTLSGKMLRSFKVRSLRKGGVSIFNTNKLAKYHNTMGAGRSKVIRKMIPDEQGQEFKPYVQRVINDQLEKAIAKEIRK